MKNALRLIRVYHDMTQSDAAARVGLSKSYISELEAGHKKVTIDVLEKYAEGFNIPMSSLMLFAERTQSSRVAERARGFIAEKVIKMLDWIDTITSESQEAKNE